MATDTLILRLGDVDDLRRPGVGSLFVDHFCEVSRDTGIRNMDPDWDRYYALEDADRLVIYVVELDGEIVGYCMCCLIELGYNVEQAQLVNDMIYVKPSVRSMGVGNLLMRAAEETAAENRADMVWQAPAHSRLDRIMAGRSDYRATFTTYTKRYQDGDRV